MNKQTIIGIFGLKAGTKLFNWLDPCCTEFCTDVQACAGIIPPGTIITGTYETPAVVGVTVYEIPISLGGATPSWAIATSGSALTAGRPYYVTFGPDKIIINFLGSVVGSQLVWHYAYQA